MALVDLTEKQAVLDAMAEFDAIGRDAFLHKYGFEKAIHYFVEYEGKSYDSKALAGAAHGYQSGIRLHADEFSGGAATVARQLEALGFSVTRPTALPDWTRDELILALDLYLRTWKQMGYGPGTAVVVELSLFLRTMAIFPPDVRSLPKFRNPAGVAMKLHNFSSINPDHTGAGMSHGAWMDGKVWDEWAYRPDELHSVALAIRATGASEIVVGETGEEEEYEADEGRLLFRKHRRYERDRTLVERKKKDVFKRTGRLACEACDFESREIYGVEIPSVIDVHHIVPLHKIGESKTKLSDLALVCPTCHRVIHAHKPFITPVELRAKRAGSPIGT
jgi:5-methylcytosine-specific restriction enzyme A